MKPDSKSLQECIYGSVWDVLEEEGRINFEGNLFNQGIAKKCFSLLE